MILKTKLMDNVSVAHDDINKNNKHVIVAHDSTNKNYKPYQYSTAFSKQKTINNVSVAHDYTNKKQ